MTTVLKNPIRGDDQKIVDLIQRGRKEYRLGSKCPGPRWFCTEVTLNRILLNKSYQQQWRPKQRLEM